MSNNVKVIGVKFNEGATDLAIFTSEELAKQHIRTTFKNMGYDRLFTRPVSKSNKDVILIPEEIASNQGTYAVTRAIMEMLDWSKIKTETKFGTLTEFMLPTSDILKTKTQVDKLTNIGVEEEDSEGNVKAVSLQVVHSEETPLPYKRIIRQLQKELENILIGSDVAVEEVEGEEVSETVKPEVKVDAEKEHIAKEKAKAEAKAKEEQERIAKEKAELEAKEKAEEEKSKAEQERIAKEEAEAKRIAEEKAKAEKELEAKRIAEEKARAEKELEAKRIAEEKAKAEKEAEAKRIEEEAKVEQERIAKEKATVEAEAKRVEEEKAKASRPVSQKFDLSSLDGIDL